MLIPPASLRKLGFHLASACFFAALAVICLFAFGGPRPLWRYVETDVHRVTSLEMLHGRLAYPLALVDGLATNDMEIFNGAQFTHWGFGVPLLQMPFHWLVQIFPTLSAGEYFPDRAIFFFYMTLCSGFVFFALYRFLRYRWKEAMPIAILLLGGLATLSLVAVSLFSLISGRFIVYEETMAYFTLCELGCLACYLLYARSERQGWAALSGGLAALGLLTRQTGFFYLLAWGCCFYLWGRDRRGLRKYVIGATPVIVFWMLTNVVKAGSPFSLGFQNSSPYFEQQFDALRFGTACSHSWQGMRAIAGQLAMALLFRQPEPSAKLAHCFFQLEQDELSRPPYLGWLPLLVLIAATTVLFIRRRKRWEALIPWLGVLALFAAYTHAGIGFGGRYTADFWPFIILGAAQPLLFLDRWGKWEKSVVVAALGAIAPALIAFQIQSTVIPSHRQIRASERPDRYLTTKDKLRYLQGAFVPEVLSTELTCHGSRYPIYGNGLGWDGGCSVGSMTNLFLGLPQRKTGHYRLSFSVDKTLADEYLVYINGKLYHAHRQGAEYAADFSLNDDRLYSRNIQVAIRWTPDWSKPDLHLYKAGLT